MLYRSLYEYFMAVVVKPGINVLAGEEMESNPTQHQASEALKKVWQKLGGSFKIALLALLPALSLSADPVTRGTLWHDVPPETPISNVVDLASSSGGGVTTQVVTNIVTNVLSRIHINGQQLTENVSITTFAPFKSNWVTGSGINSFFSSVAQDADAKDGTAFLGQLSGSSTPWVGGNCEATLQVMKNTNGTLIYIVSVYSTDISPYYWFNMSVAGGPGNGWRSYAQAKTTLAGYGITDAKIENGVITLGSNSITPLTSYTETDPHAATIAQEIVAPVSNVVFNSETYFEVNGSCMALVKDTNLVWLSAYELTNASNVATLDLYGGQIRRLTIDTPSATNLALTLKFTKDAHISDDAKLRISSTLDAQITTLAVDGFSNKLSIRGAKDWNKISAGDSLLSFTKTAVTNGVVEIWCTGTKSEL